jgi:hypothetical protein
MKPAAGPRPWSIRIACVLLLMIGSWTYWIGLRDLSTAQGVFIERFPWLSWDRDWTIVALSAEFTIALIPVTLIYVFARGIARWLVTVFGSIKIYALLASVAEYWGRVEVVLTPLVIEAGIYLALIGLLFTPGASRWFAKESSGEDVDVAVFE